MTTTQVKMGTPEADIDRYLDDQAAHDAHERHIERIQEDWDWIVFRDPNENDWCYLVFERPTLKEKSDALRKTILFDYAYDNAAKAEVEMWRSMNNEAEKQLENDNNAAAEDAAERAADRRDEE